MGVSFVGGSLLLLVGWLGCWGGYNVVGWVISMAQPMPAVLERVAIFFGWALDLSQQPAVVVFWLVIVLSSLVPGLSGEVWWDR